MYIFIGINIHIFVLYKTLYHINFSREHKNTSSAFVLTLLLTLLTATEVV